MSFNVSGIFDEFALDYDKWYEKNKFAYFSELDALKCFLPLNAKSLEIGAGTGRFMKDLDISVGIDISFKMLKAAYAKKMNVFCADAGKLPFKNRIFDAVLITTALCFMGNPEKTLLESKRVLKKPGILVLGIIDKNSFLGKEYEKSKSRFYSSADFFDVKKAVKLLKRCGFAKFDFKQTLFCNLKKMKSKDVFKSGYGKGGFVVIKAETLSN